MDIQGFEGLYKIHQNGDVYSCYTKKILKSWIGTTGYLHVILCKDKKKTTKK